MSPYYSELRAAFGHQLLLIPSVAALIRDEAGRLLLQRKSDGSWSLPAGAIEPGESPEEALYREVKEETGLEVVIATLTALFGGKDFRFVYPNGDCAEYIVSVFECETRAANTADLDEETVELRYFSQAEFPGLQLPYPLQTLYPRGVDGAEP